MPPRQVAKTLRRHAGHRSGQGIDERLQEQRALGRVAPRRQHHTTRFTGGCRGLGREAGLADPCVSDQQQHTRGASAGRCPRFGQPRYLGATPDQLRSRSRDDRGDELDRGRAPTAEHREVHLTRLRSWFDTEFVGQFRAESLVGPDGLGRLARGLVGGHQQAVGNFVEMVCCDRGARHCPRVLDVAGPQRSRCRTVPGRAHQLLTLHPGLIHPVGVWLADQSKPVTEQLEGPRGRGTSQRGSALGHAPVGSRQQLGSLVGIDRDSRYVAQPVGTAIAKNDVRPEQRTQSAHQGGNVLGGAPRQVAVPEHGHDGVR